MDTFIHLHECYRSIETEMWKHNNWKEIIVKTPTTDTVANTSASTIHRFDFLQKIINSVNIQDVANTNQIHYDESVVVQLLQTAKFRPNT